MVTTKNISKLYTQKKIRKSKCSTTKNQSITKENRNEGNEEKKKCKTYKKNRK